MSADYPRIRRLQFDRHERPPRAVVVTVTASCALNGWRLRATGVGSPAAPDAKREAIPAIEHIEQMCMTMH